MKTFDAKPFVDILPPETQQQIRNIDTPIDKLTWEELVVEVKYSIERMEEDLSESDEYRDGNGWDYPKQIAQCKAFLQKYKKWIK